MGSRERSWRGIGAKPPNWVWGRSPRRWTFYLGLSEQLIGDASDFTIILKLITCICAQNTKTHWFATVGNWTYNSRVRQRADCRWAHQRLVLGCVTVFVRANHQPLSLLPSAGWKISCGDALWLESTGSYGSFHLRMHMWGWQVKLRSLFNTCLHLRALEVSCSA